MAALTDSDTTTRTDIEARTAALRERYAELDGIDFLAAMIEREFPGRIAVVSGFGAEAAVMLDLVAQVDRGTPVLFLDTDKHFPETQAYRERLVGYLDLRNVRVVRPNPEEIAASDPDGGLWGRDVEACCNLRKVRPLNRALVDFDAWITGRKRYQGDLRTELSTIESDGTHIKFNPLARWPRERVEAAFVARNLPVHPLARSDFLSIGCAPCTRAAAPGEPIRAGRWARLDKTECGIHKPPRSA